MEDAENENPSADIMPLPAGVDRTVNNAITASLPSAVCWTKFLTETTLSTEDYYRCVMVMQASFLAKGFTKDQCFLLSTSGTTHRPARHLLWDCADCGVKHRKVIPWPIFARLILDRILKEEIKNIINGEIECSHLYHRGRCVNMIDPIHHIYFEKGPINRSRIRCVRKWNKLEKGQSMHCDHNPPCRLEIFAGAVKPKGVRISSSKAKTKATVLLRAAVRMPYIRDFEKQEEEEQEKKYSTSERF